MTVTLWETRAGLITSVLDLREGGSNNLHRQVSALASWNRLLVGLLRPLSIGGAADSIKNKQSVASVILISQHYRLVNIRSDGAESS